MSGENLFEHAYQDAGGSNSDEIATDLTARSIDYRDYRAWRVGHTVSRVNCATAPLRPELASDFLAYHLSPLPSPQRSYGDSEASAIYREGGTIAVTDDLNKEYFSPFDGIDNPMIAFIQRASRMVEEVDPRGQIGANWAELTALSHWAKNAMDHVRRSMAMGLPMPQITLRAAVAQIKDILSGYDPSLPYATIPDELFTKFISPSLLQGQEPRILNALNLYREQGVRKALPVYAAMLRFLEDEMLPAARSDEQPGLCHLEFGDLVYRDQLAKFSSLEPRVDELRGLAGRKLAQTQQRMSELKDRVEAEEGVAFDKLGHFMQYMRFRHMEPGRREQLGFSTVEEIEQYVNVLFKEVGDLIEERYGLYAASLCETVVVGGTLAETGIAEYEPAIGNMPAYFYLPVADPAKLSKASVLNLFMHEIIGHHYHYDYLWRNKIFGTKVEFWPFLEGWAMHAEELGEELGLYDKPDALFHRLSIDYNMAVTSLMDTGIHLDGWSIDRARRYRRAYHVDDSEETETANITRSVGWPGQQFAFLTGGEAMRQAREHAETVLGGHFRAAGWYQFFMQRPPQPLTSFKSVSKHWADHKARSL